MIELFQYQQIRKELIEQHAILTTREYRVSFPRQYLMTIDELEGKEKVYMTTVTDHSAHLRPTLMTVTIERVIDILKRLPDPRILAYKNGKDAIEIYETVQGYLSNWVEIILHASEFSHPTIQELYDLEKVAIWAFPQFQHEKRMKQFRDERDFSQQTFAHPLLQLTGILAQQDDISSFVSHLDNRLPSHLKAYRNDELFTQDLKETLNLDSDLFGIKGLL